MFDIHCLASFCLFASIQRVTLSLDLHWLRMGRYVGTVHDFLYPKWRVYSFCQSVCTAIKEFLETQLVYISLISITFWIDFSMSVFPSVINILLPAIMELSMSNLTEVLASRLVTKICQYGHWTRLQYYVNYVFRKE